MRCKFMNRSILTAAVLPILVASVYAGDYSGKELKQAPPPPCPEWYSDNEWNVILWGTYAFTNTDYARNLDLVDVVQSTTEGGAVLGEYDRYIGDDHAWGGGADIKYFFHRYFGVGVEGFVVNARKGGFDIFEDPRVPVLAIERMTHHRAVGSVLGTFTLRYPLPCTRFAPYAWAVVGAIYGNGTASTEEREHKNEVSSAMRKLMEFSPKQRSLTSGSEKKVFAFSSIKV